MIASMSAVMRVARVDDVPQIAALMRASVLELFPRYYDEMRSTWTARQACRHLEEHKDGKFALWVSLFPARPVRVHGRQPF